MIYVKLNLYILQTNVAYCKANKALTKMCLQ